MRKLNAGCGKTILPAADGWVNLDLIPGPGVDLVWDLDKPPAKNTLSPEEWIAHHSEYDEILLSHTFEHLREPLTAMETLWRMAKPDAQMIVRCPWGGSHIAFEDPTHVRQVFLQTMHYFSQTAYNAADYGYCGDWMCDKQVVVLNSKILPPDEAHNIDLLYNILLTSWNAGVEIISFLKAVKPARPAGTPSPGYKLELVFDYELAPGSANDESGGNIQLGDNRAEADGKGGSH